MNIIVFFLILGYFVLSIRSQKWALLLLLTCLPLYTIRLSFLGIPATLFEAMILLLFAVWFVINFSSLFIILKLKIKNYFQGVEVSRDKRLNTNERYPLDVEIILVLIISFIAVFVSGITNTGLGIWKAYFFEPIMVFILIFNIFFKNKEGQNDLLNLFKKIILPLGLAVFFVSTFAIFQKISGYYIPNELWAASATRRVTAIYGYPNAVGLFLAPIFLLMFSFLLAMRSKYSCERTECAKWNPISLKWFWRMPVSEKLLFSFLKITCLTSLLAIYFAKSEGALIAIVVGVIFLAFFFEPFNKFAKVRILVVVLFLILLALIFSIAPLQKSVLEKIKLNDFSGQVRKAQWQEAGIMLRDGNWLLGAGLAGYQNKIAPYHQNGIYIKNDDPEFDRLIKVDPAYQAKYWQPLEIFLYPHNIFLNFWVELGLFGMLLFLWIIIKALYVGFCSLGDETVMERRFLILGTMGAILVMAIHGIVDVPYFKNDLAVLFWVVISLIGVLQLKSNKI